MRKIINYLTIAAIALGFAACNNEDVPQSRNGQRQHLRGVTLRFAQVPLLVPDYLIDSQSDNRWLERTR